MRKKEFGQLDLALSGDAEAQYMLARHCYAPPDQDIEEAVIWLRKAADQDHIEAVMFLADLCLKNMSPSCVPRQAVGLLRQLLVMHDPNTAEEWRLGAGARIKLGMILCQGDLTGLNLRAGQKLIDIGVEQFVADKDAGGTEFPSLCAELSLLYWSAKKAVDGGITGDPAEDNKKCAAYSRMAIEYGVSARKIPLLEEMIVMAERQNEELRESR